MRHPTDDVDAVAASGEAHSHLELLRNLRDLEVAEGDPDVRGWSVHTSDGTRIGQVHDLLVDTAAMKVRYLDVEIDLDLLLGSPGTRQAGRQETIPGAGTLESPGVSPTLAGLGAAGLASMAGMVAGLPPTAVAPLVTGTYGVGAPVAENGTAVSNPHRSVTEHLVRESLSDEENRLSGEPPAREGVRADGGRRHVLIPIGRARLEQGEDRIFVDSLKREDVLNLPEYGHGPVTREFEAELLQRLDRGYVHSPERDFYAHSLYDESTFYGARRGRNSGREGEPLDDRLEDTRDVGERQDAALPSRSRS